MDIRKIRKLIELINETGVGEIEVKSGKESVRISRQGHLHNVVQPAVAAVPPPPATHHSSEVPSPVIKAQVSTGHEVRAPMVGTVYLSPTPGAKCFVDVGQHVAVGDTLCLIEAMKMFNKIEADRAGVISACMIDNNQPVEYDQVLFIIDGGA